MKRKRRPRRLLLYIVATMLAGLIIWSGLRLREVYPASTSECAGVDAQAIRRMPVVRLVEQTQDCLRMVEAITGK